MTVKIPFHSPGIIYISYSTRDVSGLTENYNGGIKANTDGQSQRAFCSSAKNTAQWDSGRTFSRKPPVPFSQSDKLITKAIHI